jgi:AbiU2
MSREAEQLREWIAAAEAARANCGNVNELDQLIQGQKQRLAKLQAGGLKASATSTVASLAVASNARESSGANTTASVSKDEVIKFSDHCAYVRSVYRYAIRLFKDRCEDEQRLMNEVAPRLFSDLDSALAEFMIVAVYRILDHAKDGRGNENFGTELFLNGFPFDEEAFGRLNQLHRSMQVFRKKIEDARHKLGAHSDRATVRSGKALATASWQDWDQFWSNLRDFVRILNEAIMGSPFEIEVAGVPGDAEMLFKALKAYSIVARKA